jgi:hypothetical protein
MKLMKIASIALATLTMALTVTACKNEPKAQTAAEAAPEAPEMATGKIQYSIKPDGRNWKKVTDDTQQQLKLTQYILANEQPEDITELFTVIEMTDINITPPEYFSQFITELQKRYSNIKVESKVINQTTNSLFGEWWIDGKSPDNNQHEWIRIIKKGNDIAVLRYSTKHQDKLEEVRKVWESILNNAKF